jgi:hypothetical protein
MGNGEIIMNYKTISLSAIALAILAGGAAFAAEDAKESTHDGTIVSITNTELVMKGKDDKEHTHTLAKSAKLTLDGKTCKAEDLKAGLKIRVTTKTADAKAATNVEAISKNALFANTHEGKVVSATSSKLVMTGGDGKEHSHTITDDTKVTCDKKDCRATDLKAGTKIRVTTKKSDETAATCIEAIVKDGDFAQQI